MSDPTDTYVICDNVKCELHEKKIYSIAMWETFGVDLPDFEAAKSQPVECHVCAKAKRPGMLVYVTGEHLSSVGARFVDGEWKRVPREEHSAVPTTDEDVHSHDPAPGEDYGTLVGVALDVIPYGGYTLRYQDRDDLVMYGPRQDDLPNQDPAQPNYILELQDDLIFLCYWNTLRAEPKKLSKAEPGVFHYSMIGSIIALKDDLYNFYGVPTTKDINATKISLDVGSKLTLEGLNIPIYYDPDLVNPVFELFREFFDPVILAYNSALKIANGWASILKNLSKGKIKKNHRNKLEGFANDAVEARDACAQALTRVNTIAPPKAPLASAEALLDDPVFKFDVLAGKHNWTGFAKAVEKWEGSPAKLDPDGHVQDCLFALTTFTPADDENEEAITHYQRLHAAYVDLCVSLDAAFPLGSEILGGLPQLFALYQAKLREYASVDWATAAYIHAMRYGIPIGGKGAIKRAGGVLAFRLPDQGIDVGIKHSADQLYPMAINIALKLDVPPPIVLERFGGESGFEHTFTLKKMAAAKAHKGVKLPKMGTDYANWYTAETSLRSTYCFSELFSRGPGDWQRGGGRGYAGPLMMSRGWGISQATRGTFYPGVTKKGRADECDQMHWLLGLPIAPDNSKVVMSAFIASTAGGVEDGVGILRNKFDKSSRKHRVCTYARIGKEHDCHSCLKRFDVKKDFKYEQKLNSYSITVDPERFYELMDEEMPDDTDELLEWPCSWLTAVMRYGGTGLRTFERLQKTAKKIANPKGDLADYIDKF